MVEPVGSSLCNTWSPFLSSLNSCAVSLAVCVFGLLWQLSHSLSANVTRIYMQISCYTQRGEKHFAPQGPIWKCYTETIGHD